jgi:hypothetical protein
VNSSTTYNYDMRTQIYSQPAFAHQTLQRLLGTNNSILNSLRTTREVHVERRDVIPVGTSLAELISIGNKDQSVAPTVLDAVLAELGQQTELVSIHAISSKLLKIWLPDTLSSWQSTTSRRCIARALTETLCSLASSHGICLCLASSWNTLVARSPS